MKNKIVILSLLAMTSFYGITGCGNKTNSDENAKIPIMETDRDGSQNAQVSLVDNSTQADAETVSIQAEEAKRIALDDAGLNEDEVTFQTVEYEHDDGISYYEIEFSASVDGQSQKYEYDINTVDGSIASYSLKPIKSEMVTEEVITEEEAKQIVLAKAGITETEAIHLKLEYEDGVAVYEGEFTHNDMKYEFEIDAASGRILEWDSESVYDD